MEEKMKKPKLKNKNLAQVQHQYSIFFCIEINFKSIFLANIDTLMSNYNDFNNKQIP